MQAWRLLDSMAVIPRKLQVEDRAQAADEHARRLTAAREGGQDAEAYIHSLLAEPEKDKRLRGCRLRAVIGSWAGLQAD
ncbi:MAG: hypothetical protein ACI841_001468 [Planctomycetota bacterium]|jgi:hypothetical protein